METTITVFNYFQAVTTNQITRTVKFKNDFLNYDDTLNLYLSENIKAPGIDEKYKFDFDYVHSVAQL